MKNKEKLYTMLDKVAKIIYLIHLIFAFNALINMTFILDITMVLSLFWACVVLVLRIKDIKYYIRRKDFWILAIFVISFMLTSIFNIEYGIIKNIKCLVWMAVQIIVLYFSNPQRDIEFVKEEFELISKVFIGLSVVTNIISLAMFFLRYENLINIDGTYFMIGFYWNRLFGIYNDPNQGALFAVITILMIAYLASQKRRVWHGIVLFIQISFILLSDSRTGALSLSIALGIYVAIKIMRRKVTKHAIFAVIVAVALAGFTYGVRQPLQQLYVSSVNNIYDYFVEQHEEPDEESVGDTEVIIEREELTKDPSNRRFDIWTSGIELFLCSPILGFGRNYIDFALEKLPETYIVNNDMGDFDSMHNIAVELLVQQGVLGTLVFCTFLIYCVSLLIRKYRYIKKENQEFASICFSIICAIAVASMLMPTVIYLNSPESYLMWLSLGYLLLVVEKDSEKIISAD